MKSRLRMGLVALVLAAAAVAGGLAVVESPDIIVRTAGQMLATSPMIMPGG